MNITKEDILRKLTEVKPMLKEKYMLEEIALFGSFARDEQNDKSDIDIMVKLKNINYRNLCNTVYSLYDLFPNMKVQVVSKGGIKPQYFERLKNDLLYA
jgi:uncharacterized protein